MWHANENAWFSQEPAPQLRRRHLLQMGLATLPALLSRKPAFADEGFPVTIRHAFGETTLTRRPERIVTLGWAGEDPVIALGVLPVGMTGYPLWDTRIAEWNRRVPGERQPFLMNSRLDYERIATLKPDLILAVFSGVDELAYSRLRRVAPVVTFRDKPWSSDWREQAILAGRALGKPLQAQELVRAAETALDRMRASFPALEGQTFALVSHFPRQNGFDVYLHGDRRLELFERLGMKLSPRVAALGQAAGSRYSRSIGLEHIDMFDGDLLVAWFATGMEDALSAQPVLRTLPAVKRKTLVPLDTPEKVWSVMTPTVQSIPHGFTTLVPELAAAAMRSGE